MQRFISKWRLKPALIDFLTYSIYTYLLCFGLHQLLSEIFVFLAASCFTIWLVWKQHWQGQWDWIKVVGLKTNTTSWKMLKCSKEMRETAELGDDSLHIHHYKQHLSQSTYAAFKWCCVFQKNPYEWPLLVLFTVLEEEIFQKLEFTSSGMFARWKFIFQWMVS